MKKAVIILNILMLFVSDCGQATKTKKKQEFDRTIPNYKEEQNHFFLNVILERWEKLSNARLERNNEQMIDIEKIILLKYKCDFDSAFYPTTGFIFVVSPYDINLEKDKRDTIISQLKSANETWNHKLVNSILMVDTCLKEMDISRPQEMHEKNSFLVISEPIEFKKDAFWILSRLYTKQYGIISAYIIEKANDTVSDEFRISCEKFGEWTVVNAPSALIKYEISTHFFENHENKEDCDDFVEEITIYQIFDNYIDLYRILKFASKENGER